MPARYLIGLDIGGSGGRCLILDRQTGSVTTSLSPWTHPPDPGAGGWAFALDTTRIWRALGQTVRLALAQAGVAPGEVAGLAATSFRHGTVVVDRHGNVLLATPNKDARAADFGMDLAMDRGPQIYQRTGHFPGAIFISSRLAWMKARRPEALAAAHAVLSVSDWIGYLLTGVMASEPSQAAESGLLDLNTRAWAGDLIEAIGVPASLFPPLRPAGTRLGNLSEAAAAHLGLAPGTPVAVGAADTQAGLLGVGATAPGQLAVIAGTTTPVQLVTDRPVLDPQMRTWAGLHAVPGQYVIESNAGAMGTALEWIARLLFPEGTDPVASLCAAAGESTPGANGVVSTVGAQVFNAAAMGLPVDNLTFSSVSTRAGPAGRADIARAVLEGMAYAVRANLEQIRETAGTQVEEVWLGGGMSRSARWSQILSDVLGCRLHTSTIPEASAMGAALCAAVGAGLVPDLVTAARSLVPPAREYTPGEAARTYAGHYADWQALRRLRTDADEAVANQIIEQMPTPQPVAPGQASAGFRPRIYVSADLDPAALDDLRNLGEVTHMSYREGRMLVGDELVETLAGYHVFVTEVDILSAEDLVRLPDLRLVAVCRGNPVNIDIPACTAAGIPVVNTPARNADAVADLAVAFMLMLARKLPDAAAFLHEPGSEAGDMGRMGVAHERFMGAELWCKTIGVVGGGAIGRKVVARLLPFGARALVYDPYLSPDQVVLMGAEPASLDRLLQASDFVTLHAPVTETTQGMIDARALGLMKPGAFLVNTARAALVDSDALLEALRSARLGGAALDVFPVEPPGAEDPLLAMPNVIATPHVGGNTQEVAAHQGAIVAAELRRLLAGQAPEHVLNPDVLATFAWTGERKVAEEELHRLATVPGPGVSDLDVAAQRRAASAPPPAKKPGLLASLKKAVGGEKAASRPATASSGTPDGARQTMVRILEVFTENVCHDATMAAFAAGKHVVFLFTIKDLDRSFFLNFVDGAVDAGLGSPPREPDVRLKMSADTLDGMFTGRVNAMKAAMGGKLSFSGDTGKAMAFQRIQADMGRLYTEARGRVGDPGDLTQVGAASPAPATSAASPSAQPIHVGSAEGSFARVGDIRDTILAVTGELYAKGLITPTGGNVSARCDDNPNQVWITPSAIFKGDLRPAMMVRIDLDGNVVGETDYSASSERRVHCAIYKARPDIQAVVHSHAPQAILMALTGTKFLPVSTEAAFLGDIPVVPFIMPGTNELGDRVAEAMGSGSAALMQNHGLVVAGSSLRRAADNTDVIEVTAHKILTCKALGVEPPVLPDDVVKTLREMGAMMA